MLHLIQHDNGGWEMPKEIVKRQAGGGMFSLRLLTTDHSVRCSTYVRRSGDVIDFFDWLE